MGFRNFVGGLPLVGRFFKNKGSYSDRWMDPPQSGVLSKAQDRIAKDVADKVSYPWLYFGMGQLGVPREFDAREQRRLGTSDPVEMAIQWIQDMVGEAEWHIVKTTQAQKQYLFKNPYERKTRKLLAYEKDARSDLKYRNAAEAAGEFLSNPDVRGTISFDQESSKAILDMSEVGDAVWQLKFNSKDMEEKLVNGKLHRFPKSGAKPIGYKSHDVLRFNKDRDQWGNVTGYINFPNDGQASIAGSRTKGSEVIFTPEEICWFVMNPRPDRCYGFSPTEKIKKRIDLLMLTVDQETDIMVEGDIGPGVLWMEDWMNNEVKMFREYYEREVQGHPGKIAIAAGKGKFSNFTYSYKDLQFLERQQFYWRVALGMFKQNMTIHGMEASSGSRARDIVQSISAKKKSVGPTMSLIEYGINSQILWRYFSPKLSFVFIPDEDMEERKAKSDMLIKEVDKGLTTSREARVELGRDDVLGSDILRDPNSDELPLIRQGMLWLRSYRDGGIDRDEYRKQIDRLFPSKLGPSTAGQIFAEQSRASSSARDEESVQDVLETDA